MQIKVFGTNGGALAASGTQTYLETERLARDFPAARPLLFTERNANDLPEFVAAHHGGRAQPAERCRYNHTNPVINQRIVKHPFRSALDHEQSQQEWMTLPEQAGLDELAPTRSPAQRELAPSCASAPADWELKTDLYGAVDRAATARASLADVSEIKVDRSQRLFVVRSRNRAVGLLSLLGACSVALASAYVFVGGLASPFDLTWIGRSSGHRVLDREPTPPPPPAQAASSRAPISDAKGDRLRTNQTVMAPPDRQEAAHPDLLSSPAMTRSNPLLAGRSPTRAPSASREAVPMRPHPTSIATAAATPQSETRITTPVPETRPTTIEGWTLREVVNGAAVVEGPGGSFRVARGDTLPGAGRVLAIVRWGNRLMVATSAGLISTP